MAAKFPPLTVVASHRARRILGAAALAEMLEMIGSPAHRDPDVARILVDCELELRALLEFALASIADEAS